MNVGDYFRRGPQLGTAAPKGGKSTQGSGPSQLETFLESTSRQLASPRTMAACWFRATGRATGQPRWNLIEDCLAALVSAVTERTKMLDKCGRCGLNQILRFLRHYTLSAAASVPD